MTIEVMAVIPARGGSKSIPRKNILDFAGHPLIAYSIAAGLQAKHVTRVVVSTDDEEIAEVGRRYGAEVPFLRPAEYAQDNTPDLPVFEHALAWFDEHEGYRPDVLVQLRPTSPVRPPDCVDRAIEILLENPQADSTRGVVVSGQNPFKMWTFAPEGHMQPLLKVEGLAEPFNAPRQKLPQTYWQTGHVDAIRRETILNKKSLSGDVIMPLLIDQKYTVDIDTMLDWQQAERLVRQKDLPCVKPNQGGSRGLPQPLELIVFDFDGVFTDDRVWVDQQGGESVAANRSDGMGIGMLRDAGYEMLVLSTEVNPVVSARCQKLGLPVHQGVGNKAVLLMKLLADKGIQAEQVLYMGNDVNDLACLEMVGCAVVVADAHPDVLPHADIRLEHNGGHGAVRELCDMILKNTR